MTAGERRPPDPRRRASGWTMIVAAVVLGLLALAEVPTAAPVVRILVAVLAAVLLVLGLTRFRATVPGVASFEAGESGLAITVTDGAVVTLPWSDLAALDLRRVTTLWRTEHHVLRLRLRGAARRPRTLERYEGDSETGLGQLLIGLTGEQEDYLRRRLPDLAGERFAVRD